MIDGHLEPKMFEIKKTEIVMRRRDIAHILDDNVMADDQFKDALCKVISLAAKSNDLFESSKTEENCGLLGFVFLNLKLEGPALRYDLRKPFEQFAKLPNNPEWRPLIWGVLSQELNHNAKFLSHGRSRRSFAGQA